MRMTGPRPGERVPLEDIDLYDPGKFQSQSQHPAFATLREEAPLWQQRTPDGSPFWSVTRYRDVVAVLKDVRSYSSEHGTILAVTRGDSAGGRTINLMDPPTHTSVRVPTIRTMSTHVLRQRADRVRDHVRRVIAPCFDGGSHDFAQLMLDLPMAAVGEIMGIPQQYWSDIPRWTMSGVAPDDPDYTQGMTEQTLREAHYDLFAMFRELIDHRRRHPTDDLISMLTEIELDGRRMDDERILLNCYSFVMGANTTTPHTASHTLLALVENPSAWQQLRADPALATATVEEGLRWSTPTNHLMRRTNRPVEIEGTRLDADALVVAWVASANRDTAVFADPYTFDIHRSPNPHVAFGIGPHYCIGGPAARTALVILFEELATGFEEFTLAGDVVHLRSNFINGLTRLPVEVTLDRSVQPAAFQRTPEVKVT